MIGITMIHYELVISELSCMLLKTLIENDFYRCFFTDINECLSSDTNNCNQQCTDTSGSYLCYCDEGYNLGIDYFTCEGNR